MTHSANETLGQARQGSVAAIIQVLNEQLADAGIRTRAMVADGFLQLLCEAATPEQLNQQIVVERVRQALETISPHRIKKVKINSRIVKEQQLLWLEEVNRDPENSLLWAEVITLKRPFFVKRWIRDRHLKPAGPIFADLATHPPKQNALPSKIAAGVALLLLILAAGWLFREDLSQSRQATETIPVPEGDQPLATASKDRLGTGAVPPAGDHTADITPPTNIPAAERFANQPAIALEAVRPSSAGPVTDAFAEAVRLAQQAAVEGKTATATADWLELAADWQRAADLMGDIPTGAQQYTVAQDRVKTYRANSKAALQEAAAASANQD
ncbi:MAG: hypothetical protein WBB01_22340 [Phormidesmis sp.]